MPPPHYVKQIQIKELANKFNAQIFVETGTYQGDMIYAMRDVFKQLYSVELGEELCKKAQKRFKSLKHIQIFQGDSADVLPSIMKLLKERCLFWLDGHYSAGITALGDKETPIYSELNTIFNAEDFGHVILIDDARCFIGKNDYPKLLELKEFVKSKKSSLSFNVENDIIQICP